MSMPLPPNAPLTIVAGDTFFVKLFFKDTTGAAIDLSGSTFRATWRPTPSAPISVPFSVDATSLGSGLVAISMPPSSTATLNSPSGVWDLERTITATGTVTTMLAGPVSWVLDVTR